MALISCSSCGTEISDKAAVCPKCGWKNNINENNIRSKSLRWIPLSLLLVVFAEILNVFDSINWITNDSDFNDILEISFGFYLLRLFIYFIALIFALIDFSLEGNKFPKFLVLVLTSAIFLADLTFALYQFYDLF